MIDRVTTALELIAVGLLVLAVSLLAGWAASRFGLLPALAAAVGAAGVGCALASAVLVKFGQRPAGDRS